jgi:hypothetical protein
MSLQNRIKRLEEAAAAADPEEVELTIIEKVVRTREEAAALLATAASEPSLELPRGAAVKLRFIRQDGDHFYDRDSRDLGTDLDQIESQL